jgi:competence protein ComEC
MEGYLSISQIVQSKSKTFLAFCFCFLCGTAIASLYIHARISGPVIFGISLACIGLVSIFWSNIQARFILLCCIVIIFACVRYGFALPIFTDDVEKTFDTKQTVIGTIVTEPDRRIDKTNYIVETKEYGRMFVEGTRYPERKYGEVYELYCTIKKPEASDDFRYDMYLARQGIFAICDRGVFGEQVGKEGNVLFTGVLALKSVVADRINRLWHEPYASFVAGILYGYRGGLGSLNEDFSRTGVTHIVAVSGFNITIIATVLMTMITRFFLPRRKAFWVVVFGVIVFVVFTGMSASVVRAGIMGIITLVAYQLGRLSRIGNTLAATAVVMTLHNPFVLMWDAGFQLSFISTMGLVYVCLLYTSDAADDM